MNLVSGVKFKATFPVFTGNYPNTKFSHNVEVVGLIKKESYGAKTGQHTFQFEVLETSDNNSFPLGKICKKMGRNLYPNITDFSLPDDYTEKEKEKEQRSVSIKISKAYESLSFYHKSLISQDPRFADLSGTDRLRFIKNYNG